MPLIELPSGCLPVPTLSENATDLEIREAWKFLNRVQEALTEEKKKQEQKGLLLGQELEEGKWQIFRRALGDIRRLELDGKAGEDKSREVGKELAAVRKSLGLEEDRLKALEKWL